MSASLKVEGFDEMDDNLSDLLRMGDRDALVEIGSDALASVADVARGLVRRRTGRLGSSIAVGTQLSPAQAAQSQPDPGTVEIYVGPGPLPQAITEEFGTYRESPHPFMRPAWDGQASEVVARIRAAAGDRLRRFVKG